MRFAMIVFECALLLVVSAGFQAAAQESGRPDIVLNTPNTIRIQSLDDPANGHWVATPGFAELASPTFSRDGRWIAFDGYKQGFDKPQGFSVGSPGEMAGSSSGWLSAQHPDSRPMASGS